MSPSWSAAVRSFPPSWANWASRPSRRRRSASEKLLGLRVFHELLNRGRAPGGTLDRSPLTRARPDEHEPLFSLGGGSCLSEMEGPMRSRGDHGRADPRR